MEQWQQRIMDCQQSGMSIKAWCQENGVATSSYYHYLRKIRENMLQEKQIVPLELPKPSSSPAIRIESGSVTVTLPETALHEEVSQLKDENAIVKEQLAWLKKQVYGQKSEKTEVVLETAEQLPLFDEAEQTADVNLKNPEYIDVKASKRIKRTRDEIYADMEVEEVYHAVEDKTCDKCGAEMTVIGKEKIRDELVYVPARMFLRRHIAEVAKCTACGTDEARDNEYSDDIEPCHIRTAEVPAPMIPYSFCTPELLAYIAYEKYCKAVPLTRLEKDFKAKGVNLSSTTMANWIIMASQRWLKPVWEQMHRELLTAPVIHADKTVVQVLHEPGKKAKTDSRMWVYHAQHKEGKYLDDRLLCT
jgi:hypothetical protein